MKLCRFTTASRPDVRVGLITNGRTVLDLTDAGVHRMRPLIERADLVDELTRFSQAGLPDHPLDGVRLLTPVESQEVWAAGVTYLRSKEARMVESEFSANVYDLVYDAARPDARTAESCRRASRLDRTMRIGTCQNRNWRW
jgi:2-dehydro-3-deoxy-D-arabinonate dehydratase